MTTESVAIQPSPAETQDSAATPASAATSLGWVMAFSATFSYSIATPTARAAIMGGFDPNALLFARMWLTVALLLLTMLLLNRRQLRAGGHCIQISLIAGLINGVGLLAYFWGLARLEASMAAMIISISPLIVLSLLALRGEKLTYRHLIRLALALGGLFLLIGPGGAVDPLGILFVGIAALAFAVQLVIIQWYLVAHPARTVTFYQVLGMTILVTALVAHPRGRVGRARPQRLAGHCRVGCRQHLCRPFADVWRGHAHRRRPGRHARPGGDAAERYLGDSLPWRAPFTTPVARRPTHFDQRRAGRAADQLAA